ncbi:hypothetical protein [Gallaecimonas sp. GXIMD4217]|uniref:hypothetical protein n=1 Tax=Gallaecimonas sp. GXIMD4217 TaxID=3131927 RepID=UPI00311B319E
MRLIACLYDPRGQLSLDHPLVRLLLPAYRQSCPHGGHWLRRQWLVLYDRAEDFQLLDDDSFGLVLGHPLLYPDRQASLALLHGSPYRWLDRCRGHFALLQGLSSSGHLLAATDPLGLVPLYRLEHQGCQLLSNDLGWLSRLPLPLAVDSDALLDWLSLGFPLGEGSGYQGVRTLGGGRYWVLKGRGAQTYHYRNWAGVPAPLTALAPQALRTPHFGEAQLDWGLPKRQEQERPWRFQPGERWAEVLFSEPRAALARQQDRYNADWAPLAELARGNALFRLGHDLRWHWQGQARRQRLDLPDLALPGLDGQLLASLPTLNLPPPRYPGLQPRHRLCRQGLGLWQQHGHDWSLARQLFGTLLGQTHSARGLQARLLYRQWQQQCPG